MSERQRLLRQLKRERARAQKYFDVADVIMVVIDRNEKVTLINRKGCRCLGYGLDEIIGKNWFDCFLPESIREETRTVFRTLVRGETKPVEYFENPILTSSGEERLIAWHNTILTDEKGKISATLSSGEDITERNRAEETRMHLASIVESSVDAIISSTLEGTIRSWNAGAENLYGYSAEEALGKSTSILVTPDRLSELQEIYERISRGDRIEHFDTVRRRRDGRRIEVSLTVSPMRDVSGKIIGASAIARDISEQKTMLEELRQSREFATLGEMATAVAHQIKNPLAAIHGTLQVLVESPSKDNDHRMMMQELLNRVTTLDHMVNRLLMFAKRWKPQKQRCDLRDVIVEISRSAQARETFHGIRFLIDGRPGVEASVDGMLFGEVIWNILHNAADSMPKGGEIRFQVDQTARDAIVTISDTGTGIAPEVLEKLFRPFFTQKSHGTGLGLAICKKIMEAHRGSIGVSSQLGRGTQVTLSFPKG